MSGSARKPDRRTEAKRARPQAQGASAKLEHRGYRIHKSRTWCDYRVTFPCGRSRFGTLESVQADIDAYIAGTLPPPARRGHASAGRGPDHAPD